MRQQAGINSSEIKLHNVSAILVNLLQNGGISRVHLAQIIGVSTTTITNLVAELITQGLVVEEGTIRNDEQPSVGRPQKALQIVADSRFALGIYIEVGLVRVTLTDLLANPLHYETLHHAVPLPATDVLPDIVEMVDRVIRATGVDRAQIVGVGVTVSGLVDPYTGVNVFAPNLGWHNIPLRDFFSEQLGLPVVVDNTVRAMALAEALFGSAKDVNALAFVYARVGVGAGLVVGGELYRGAAAGAGEIGHTTIVLEGGEKCHCGNRGCLETLISETVILRLAHEISQQDPKGLLAEYLSNEDESPLERVFAAARAGDRATLQLLEERAHYMGIALANLVNIFNPELIVLGGIFYSGADLLLPTVEDTVRQRAFANLGSQVRVQITQFGDHAGIIGAAALALDSFFYRSQFRLASEAPLAIR